MRVALYARVSTVDQKVDLQLNELRRYAEQRGFQIVKEFVDVGISGAKDRRPQLNQLMDFAKKRKCDAVLCWKFDRFARSTQHLVTALNEFRSLGVQFLSYSENLDTSSPMGAAMFTVIAAMAQLERDLIRERTIAGLKAAKARGVVLGAKPLNKDTEVLSLFSQGQSLRKIAQALGVSKSYAHKVLKSA